MRIELCGKNAPNVFSYGCRGQMQAMRMELCAPEVAGLLMREQRSKKKCLSETVRQKTAAVRSPCCATGSSPSPPGCCPAPVGACCPTCGREALTHLVCVLCAEPPQGAPHGHCTGMGVQEQHLVRLATHRPRSLSAPPSHPSESYARCPCALCFLVPSAPLDP